MKKAFAYITMLLVLSSGVFSTSLVCYGEGTEAESLIASAEESSNGGSLDVGGLVAVYGSDIEDGTYMVETETDSSMFRFEAAELSVSGGEITAIVTMGGTGFNRLYAGTAAEAAESYLADSPDIALPLDENASQYSFEIPVEALNKSIKVSGMSARKEKWYEHDVVFYADGIPTDKISVDLDGAKLKLEDGSYSIEAELKGGTGKASIESPLSLTIADGVAEARIVWSSANYDYMLVDGKKYFPVKAESEEHSTFYIPVYTFDSPRAVIGDTTAMSTPHEIEYEIVWDSESLTKLDASEEAAQTGSATNVNKQEYKTWQIVLAFVIVLAISAVIFLKFRRKKYPWQMTEEEVDEFVDTKRNGNKVLREAVDKALSGKKDGGEAAGEEKENENE